MAALLLGALPASALDGVEWGIFDDYEDNMEDYALYKVLNDMPIRYYVEDTETQEENAKLLNKEPYTRDNETFGFDKEGNNVYTTIYRRSY